MDVYDDDDYPFRTTDHEDERDTEAFVASAIEVPHPSEVDESTDLQLTTATTTPHLEQHHAHHHDHHDDDDNDDDDDMADVLKDSEADLNAHDVLEHTHTLDSFAFPAEEMDHPTTTNNEMTAPLAREDKPPAKPPTLHKGDDSTTPTVVWEPTMWDVLAGRGASVNANAGNKRFRASCFARKPEFDAANHAAKKRITAEIVHEMVTRYGTRFLKRSGTCWHLLSTEQAMLKAAQIIRDFRRPDRVAQRLNCKKRNRATATPMAGVPEEGTVVAPIVELPEGIHSHDVLWGRGAFVNEHVGNQRLRALCTERCEQFHAGSYAEKRALAADVVHVIQSLDPPGRFLQKATTDSSTVAAAELIAGEWVQVSENKAIQKACQIMRDGKRADRIKRDENRRLRKLEKQRVKEDAIRHFHEANTITHMDDSSALQDPNSANHDLSTLQPLPLALESAEAELAAVDDAVAAATEVMNKISQPSLSEQEALLTI